MRLVNFYLGMAYPYVCHDQIQNIFSEHFKKLKTIILNQFNDLLGDGFIIVAINNKPVLTPEDVKNVIEKIKNGGVYIEGVYPNGTSAYYAFGL